MIQKEYKIINWSNWPHSIADAIRNFKGQFLKSPNILLANPHTFSQFDFLVNVMEGAKDNVKSDHHQPPPVSTGVQLSSFVFSDCKVRFCLQEDIADKHFILCQDDIDGDDQDPVIEWIPVGEGKTVNAP